MKIRRTTRGNIKKQKMKQMRIETKVTQIQKEQDKINQSFNKY